MLRCKLTAASVIKLDPYYVPNANVPAVFMDSTKSAAEIGWNSTRGYQRSSISNDGAAAPWYPMIIPHLGKVTKFTAKIYGYYNNPGGSMHQNRVRLTYSDGSARYIGTYDVWSNSASGQNRYTGGTAATRIYSNVLGSTYSALTPVGATVTGIHYQSSSYLGYAPGYCGVRDMVAEYQ